jgi:hypothetical protein
MDQALRVSGSASKQRDAAWPILTSHRSSSLPYRRLRHAPLKLSRVLPDQKRNVLRQFEIKRVVDNALYPLKRWRCVT